MTWCAKVTFQPPRATGRCLRLWSSVICAQFQSTPRCRAMPTQSGRTGDFASFNPPRVARAMPATAAAAWMWRLVNPRPMLPRGDAMRISAVVPSTASSLIHALCCHGAMRSMIITPWQLYASGVNPRPIVATGAMRGSSTGSHRRLHRFNPRPALPPGRCPLRGSSPPPPAGFNPRPGVATGRCA